MSTEQPEVQQQVTTTPQQQVTTTKVVTKQKDPKRVAMGRQLGLRSKEYKLKKQEMMKSEKHDLEGEEPKSSNKTPVIAAGGVVLALGLGYFIFIKLKQSLSIPTLTPAIIEQRDSYEQKTKSETEVPKYKEAKVVIPKLTGVVNME